MSEYTPNPMAAQSAQAGALRTYVPNRFAGGAPMQPGAQTLSPHLSTPASERPFAADIADLREGGYGSRMPNLDQMWQYSPATYEQQVSSLLRKPDVARELGTIQGAKQSGDYRMQINPDRTIDYKKWDGTQWITGQPPSDDGATRRIRREDE